MKIWTARAIVAGMSIDSKCHHFDRVSLDYTWYLKDYSVNQYVSDPNSKDLRIEMIIQEYFYYFMFIV